LCGSITLPRLKAHGIGCKVEPTGELLPPLLDIVARDYDRWDRIFKELFW